MDPKICMLRARLGANNPFVKLRGDYTIQHNGIIVFDTEPSAKKFNLAAFPVEKVIMEHRVRSMAYQHWFRFIHALTLTPHIGTRILDVGAGDCMVGHFLYQNLRKPKYAAIDLDAKRLEKAILRGFGREEFLFIQRDLVRPLPFPDKSFDVVISYESLEHLEKHHARKLIDECYRVLVKDGKLSLSTPNNRGEKIAEKYKRFKAHGKKNVFEEHPYEWRYGELHRVIREAGFRYVKGYGLDLDHVRQAQMMNNEAGEDTSYELLTRRILEYFPTSIARMFIALTVPFKASFVMVEAEK